MRTPTPPTVVARRDGTVERSGEAAVAGQHPHMHHVAGNDAVEIADAAQHRVADLGELIGTFAGVGGLLSGIALLKRLARW